MSGSRRIWLACLAVACVLAGGPRPAQAGAMVSAERLLQWGIQPGAFRLMGISGNGRVLVAAEKSTDLRSKAQGLIYKMHVFHLEGTTVGKPSTFNVPLTIWDQIAINDDGTQAILVGELGSKILEADLNSGAVRVLMEHQNGVPGFRCDPRIVWPWDGKYYIVGYYQDAQGVNTPDVVARLNLTKTGPEAFEKVLDVVPMEKQASPRHDVMIIMTPDQAIFVGPRANGKQELRLWNGGKASVLATGQVFGTVAAAQNRVLYAMRSLKSPHAPETWVKDFATGQQWPVGKPGTIYNYGFISGDGKTIAIGIVDFKVRKVSMFYGRESEKFALKPIEGLQNVDMGSFRFASQGNGCAWLDKNGLQMTTLP